MANAAGDGKARYDLSGRVAVVTGGAIGIGAAVAAALTLAGTAVVVWDRNPPSSGIAADVTDRAAIDAAVAQTLHRYGRIDILVNNAGYAGLTQPVLDYPVEEWLRIIEVNLNGLFYVSRAIAPLMVKAGWGRIVNIASLAGKEGTPNSAAYSVSKAGAIAFTKALGKELAGTGVLVNALAPAAIRTTLLDQMSPAHVQTMIAKSPLGRLGEVEEVAELALWLCSESCTFNTGAIFDLSGGRATY